MAGDETMLQGLGTRLQHFRFYRVSIFYLRLLLSKRDATERDKVRATDLRLECCFPSQCRYSTSKILRPNNNVSVLWSYLWWTNRFTGFMKHEISLVWKNVICNRNAASTSRSYIYCRVYKKSLTDNTTDVTNYALGEFEYTLAWTSWNIKISNALPLIWNLR